MQERKYWEQYYDTDTAVSAPAAPSQFAAFVLCELKGIDTQIVDFGCGNGRDSLFFARHGYNVIGVDASSSAVEKCSSENVPGSSFICESISGEALDKKILSELAKNPNKDTTIYARFFIHAIDEELQSTFLELCHNILQGKGRVALEFRTNRDANLAKVTPTHYRRFVDPLDFMKVVRDHGFGVSYFTEGFGYAKYGDDDAHVARFIITSNSDE